MNFDLGLDHPGNTDHEQSLHFKKELGCNLPNSHKCLNVFRSKGFRFFGVSCKISGHFHRCVCVEWVVSVNGNTSAMRLSLTLGTMVNLDTFVSLEPCH